MRNLSSIPLVAIALLARAAFATESDVLVQLRSDLAAAASGDTVTIPDGLHELESALVVPAGVTLAGSGWTNCILRQTAAKASAVRLTGGSTAGSGANLRGVTVTGCKTTVDRGSTDCSAVRGNGYNTISWCCISNNTSASESGGVFIESGSVDHCLFAFNTGSYGGAIGRRNGTYGIGGSMTIDTCLFYGNTSKGSGGAIGGAGSGCWSTLVLKNCTITGNTAAGAGGGFSCPNGYGSAGANTTVLNCIIADNTAGSGSDANGKPDWSLGSNGKINAASGYNLVGAVTGFADTDVVSGAPMFKDAAAYDFHVGKTSPARELASDDVRVVDLTGADRSDDRTSGCYNYVKDTAFVVTILPYETAIFKGTKLGLAADVENPPTGVAIGYEWKLLPESGSTLTWEGLAVTNLLDYGKYQITFNVIDADTKDVLKSVQGDSLVRVTSLTNYVTAAANPLHQAPYASSATAATNLLDVVDWMIDGSTVILDEGTHVVTGMVTVAVGAKILGRGRGRTTVRQTGADRVFKLHHASSELRDLTVSGGVIADSENPCGAGIWIAGLGGRVFDCTVTNCSYGSIYTSKGVGLYVGGADGFVDRCIVTHCTQKQQGVVGASSITGMGAALALTAGTVRNTLIKNNLSQGGSSIVAQTGGTFQNCTVVSNRIEGSGAHCTAYFAFGSAVAENCLFSENIAPNNTTATSSDRCIPAWAREEGSKFGSTVKNCYWGVDTSLGVDPIPLGNVAFRNVQKGNWHLRGPSCCRNVGLLDESWMLTGTDLDGEPRLHSGKVDIGCYESSLRGLIMLIE